MIICAEASQLYFLGVFDLFGIAVAPFNGHIRVRVGIYQDVESAVPIQDRKEGNRSGDLAENRLNLVLNLFLGFFDRLLVVSAVLVSASRVTALQLNIPGCRILLVSHFPR